MKYMVMECHPAYAVVLDEEGQFRKVANMRYEVGQTLTDVTEVEIPKAGAKRKPARWISSFAAAAACLLMLLIPTFLLPGKAHASVYVTINPEVRIDVDRRDTVVGLEGVNDDGKALIEGYSYRRKDLDTVIDELVDRAIGMEYLHEGDRITLSLDTEDQEWVTAHSTSLVSQLDEYMKDKLSVTIELSCGDHGEDHGEVHIPVGEDHGNGHEGHKGGHSHEGDDDLDDIDDDDDLEDIDDADDPDDIDDSDDPDDIDDADDTDDIDDDDGSDDIDDPDDLDDIDDADDPDDIDDDDGEDTDEDDEEDEEDDD